MGPVAELETQDRPETRFIYASRINVPDYMVRGGQTFRLVTDQLGSVRFVVDSATGEIAQEITYDPFGEVISDSAPGFQPFGFAGGLYSSETGLTHFGAREYDAGLGRWTSADPISFAGGDSNLYGYVIQDTVNLFDPDGQSWRDLGTRVVGAVDGATGGLTRRIREGLGLPDGLDECSWDYRTAYGIGRVAFYVDAAIPSYAAAGKAIKFVDWLKSFPKGSPSIPTRVLNEIFQRHPDLFEKLDKAYKIYQNTWGKLKGHG